MFSRNPDDSPDHHEQSEVNHDSKKKCYTQSTNWGNQGQDVTIAHDPTYLSATLQKVNASLYRGRAVTTSNFSKDLGIEQRLESEVEYVDIHMRAIKATGSDLDKEFEHKASTSSTSIPSFGVETANISLARQLRQPTPEQKSSVPQSVEQRRSKMTERQERQTKRMQSELLTIRQAASILMSM
ncbi:uncharacterized protein IL334_007842 [Kwoniella shivajii]|uniref:Uncharacterized protein n=1 Tax=Kwoniella shivajii TaxID=564305 RepID=A0ABZ1DAM9_9TREE|nr:hypothetical protein IL334_007842 [Kwoniella shivajii]